MYRADQMEMLKRLNVTRNSAGCTKTEDPDSSTCIGRAEG